MFCLLLICSCVLVEQFSFAVRWLPQQVRPCPQQQTNPSAHEALKLLQGGRVGLLFAHSLGLGLSFPFCLCFAFCPGLGG